MPQSQNRVDIDIQIKGNAPETLKQLNDRLLASKPVSEAARASLSAFGGQLAQLDKAAAKAQAGLGDYDAAIRQWAQGVQKLEADLEKAQREAKILPSALEKMRLAVQEARIGYVEGMGDMAEETLNFADVLNQAQIHAEDFAFRTGKIWEGVSQKFNATFTEQAQFAFKQGQEAFMTFHKSLDDGLTKVFATSFTATTKETHEAWEKFLKQMEASFYQSLGRMASALVQENLLAPLFKLGQEAAGALLSAGKALFLGEGGLVTRPTLAVLGEAGPEVVLPLKAAGEFVKGSVVEAAKTQAFTEAATRAATEAGLELGVEQAGAGAAAAAGAATGAALFVMFDAVQTALGGNSAIRAIGDIAFGERGKQGLIERALGGLGLPAFRKRGGEFNLPMIQALYAEALAAPPLPPFSFNEMMARLGSDDPGRARALLAPYLAEGGFVTGPTLALIGERGREAVLPLDSPSSMRALQEGLRPIVREAFAAERRGGGGGVTVNIDARGAFFPDGRSIEQLARLIEEKLRRLPRTGRGPAFAGV